MESLRDNIPNLMQTNMLMNMNSGSPIIDMCMTSLLMFLISYFVNNLFRFKNIINFEIFDILFKKNTVIIEGKQCLKNGRYNTRTDSLFSLRFRAIWHTINTIKGNEKIYKIKEYANSENTVDNWGDVAKKKSSISDDLFVVCQERPFKINDNIYCRVEFHDLELGDGSKDKQNSKIEIITLLLYSYSYTTNQISDYIDTITQTYIEDMYNQRKNNLYIYSLKNFDYSDRDQEEVFWNECLFNSTRNFDNLFFTGKEQLIDKINFFVDNKSWYEKEGHPYTLGIALYGPPGTGKTSIIKSIANKLNRHLIVIPLNKIKTQEQFYQAYFDSTYNKNNKKNSIGFDKKIIVLDDIDCMSDIIKERSNTNSPSYNKETDVNTTANLLTAVVKGLNSNHDNENSSSNDKKDFMKIVSKTNHTSDDAITLSFLLNIIDGIMETPGRILIITSNFYERIDKAFTRPGRIDISMEMKKATKEVINNMFYHFYKKNIPIEIQNKLQNDLISPATIVNMRFQSKNSEDFLKLLEKV